MRAGDAEAVEAARLRIVRKIMGEVANADPDLYADPDWQGTMSHLGSLLRRHEVDQLVLKFPGAAEAGVQQRRAAL